MRALWHDFRKKNWHSDIQSSSLVPSSQDKTVMFSVAGMQPLVPFLMWQEHPQGWKLENLQKCLRTNDIEDIGDERHLTFFEMMGNRSLNTYFKKQSLTWSREFLTEVCGLDPERIGLTVFGGYTHNGEERIPFDQEAKDIALSLGIADKRIKSIDMIHGEKCDNFRWPAAAVWPCGPCAEFHYDRGVDRWPDDRDMWTNDRYTEIRNNVFMNMYKDDSWEYSFMERHNIDTWMWYERLLMVLQHKNSIFETDLFASFFVSLEKETWKKYPVFSQWYNTLSDVQREITTHMRIIVDHVRSSVMLLSDGVRSSNEWRGYVLRRLMRRAMFYYSSLHPQESLDVSFLIDCVIEIFADAYPILSSQKDMIVTAFQKEAKQFSQTLSLWKKHFDSIIHNSDLISGEDAFKLYDTFWFPLELTKELATQRKKDVDLDWFSRAMQKAKELSRAASWFEKWIDRASEVADMPLTHFVWYDEWSTDAVLLKDDYVKGKRYLIFDKTPFYATGWWQESDTWYVILDDGEKLEIINVNKYNWVYLHFVVSS